jgi:nucleoside-diphosphate-sugar epimerase
MSTLIVGCGYLGRHVGRLLATRGERVWGTARSPTRAGELVSAGIEPVFADVTQPDSLSVLPSAKRVVYCVGSDRVGGHGFRTVQVEGLENVLKRIPAPPERLIYASSTGVYGQADGSWVDESSPTEPTRDNGRVLLEAEALARRWAADSGARLVVLRFAGLYGPGRVVGQGLIERGEPVAGDPERFLNLVHIEDAAAAVVAALQFPDPDPVYLVSDDRPVTRGEYYSLLARLLHAPAPRFEVAGDPAGGTRDASDRKVSNRRLRSRLGVVLTYPDVTSGLPSALSLSGKEGRSP